MGLQLDLQLAGAGSLKTVTRKQAEEVSRAHQKLTGRNRGNWKKYLGWLDWPSEYVDSDEFKRIESTALEICEDTDIFIVIGIGGSYLGARAVIEFVHSQFYNFERRTMERDGKQYTLPEIWFSGNTLSPSSIAYLKKRCQGKRVSIDVISKSGSTTEPAIAFRVFRELLGEQYGEAEAKKRIYVTTEDGDKELRKLTRTEGYTTFDVPKDIGGRYSVLTPVGLLPIAVGGVDIRKLITGAAQAQAAYAEPDLAQNDCYRYALARNLLYRSRKKLELFAAYEPDFTMMCEWLKQLFGESEGKKRKGIFPASVIYSTDLHSMGQYVQQGERSLFETVITFKEAKDNITIQADADNVDGLNFLAGRTLEEINQYAYLGTLIAHKDGGVPNIQLQLERMDEENLGWLLYFFEKACAISGCLLGVNPFDQPGVEAYKKNMFALLGKPGAEHEARGAALRERLGELGYL